MKTLKIMGIYMLTIVSLLLVVAYLNQYEPAGFPEKGTLSDKYCFWLNEAAGFRANAEIQFDLGKHEFGRIDLAAAKRCVEKAEQFRTPHNRELSVSLSRSLAVIGSSPLAQEYFWNEYNMRKL